MQVIRHSDGISLTLNENNKVGEGGEARILIVPGHPDVVAKVYKNPTTAQQQKLVTMLDNPPLEPTSTGHHNIAWPSEILLSADGRGVRHLIGFLMPRVQSMEPILEFCNPKSRHDKYPLLDYRYLHRMASNLAVAIHSLHARGYVIGDINESNILAEDQARVTLIDTDSFQVRDHAAGIVHRYPVGKPEFTPPEMQGIVFRDRDREPSHDLFGLAVIIFQLLMEGFHPFMGHFTGTGESPTLDQRIKQGYFPFGSRPSLVLPGRHAPPLALLSHDLQRLFLRCFEDGHRAPSLRPTAREWQQALQAAENEMVACSVNRQHYFGRHHVACPWCAREQQYSTAPQPKAPSAKQVPLPVPPATVTPPVVGTVNTTANTIVTAVANTIVTAAVGTSSSNSLLQGINLKLTKLILELFAVAVVVVLGEMIFSPSHRAIYDTGDSARSSTASTASTPTSTDQPQPTPIPSTTSTPDASTFSPPGGWFTVRFPSSPTESTPSINTESGIVIAHKFKSEPNGPNEGKNPYVLCEVEYYDCPPTDGSNSPDSLLKSVQTSITNSIATKWGDNYKTLCENTFLDDDSMGSSLILYNQTTNSIYHILIYVAGSRVYSVYTYNNSQSLKDNMNGHFDSTGKGYAMPVWGTTPDDNTTRVDSHDATSKAIVRAIATPDAQDEAFLDSFTLTPRPPGAPAIPALQLY